MGVKELIDKLGSDDKATRSDAAIQLAKLGADPGYALLWWTDEGWGGRCTAELPVGK